MNRLTHVLVLLISILIHFIITAADVHEVLLARLDKVLLLGAGP